MNKFSNRVSFDSQTIVLRTSQNTATRMALENLKSRAAGGCLDDDDLKVEHLSSYSKVTVKRDLHVLSNLLIWLDSEAGPGTNGRTARDRGIAKSCSGLMRDLLRWTEEHAPDNWQHLKNARTFT